MKTNRDESATTRIQVVPSAKEKEAWVTTTSLTKKNATGVEGPKTGNKGKACKVAACSSKIKKALYTNPTPTQMTSSPRHPESAKPIRTKDAHAHVKIPNAHAKIPSTHGQPNAAMWRPDQQGELIKQLLPFPARGGGSWEDPEEGKLGAGPQQQHCHLHRGHLPPPFFLPKTLKYPFLFHPKTKTGHGV